LKGNWNYSPSLFAIITPDLLNYLNV